MSILVKFDLTPQNGKKEQIKTFLREILPETRKYSGNEGVILSLAEDRKSERLMLIEYWRSQVDFKNYLNWRLEIGDLDKLESMLVQELEFSFFNILDNCWLL